jgi:Flp pilus assembly protein TadG
MARKIAFVGDDNGSVAIAFALSLMGLVAGLGVAMDYSRLSDAKTTLQSALDSAILSAGKTALATGKPVDRNRMITEMKANLPDYLQPFAANVQITQSANRIAAEVSGSLTSHFGSLHGTPRSTISAAASVDFSAATAATRIEVALVLDTTHSMTELGKMVEMKKAANALIDLFAEKKRSGVDVAMGVVPFNEQVRIDTSNAGAPWLFLGTPMDIFINKKTWGAWNGCLTDRDKPLHRSRAVPNTNQDKEKYPVLNCVGWIKNMASILPLTTNLDAVRARVDSLVPTGDTNTVIGMVWGLNILNPSAPLGSGAAPASRKPDRMLVFLTDGINTYTRHSNVTATIDADMRELCRDAKTSDVRIFTVRLIRGNDDLLRDCATDPANFYAVNDVSGLTSAFHAIGGKGKPLSLSR